MEMLMGMELEMVRATEMQVEMVAMQMLVKSL